jgi:hypothetical protein
MAFLVSTQTVERSLSNMSILFGQVCCHSYSLPSPCLPDAQVVRGANAGARVLEYVALQPSTPRKVPS